MSSEDLANKELHPFYREWEEETEPEVDEGALADQENDLRRNR